jgi:hypothetical protein
VYRSARTQHPAGVGFEFVGVNYCEVGEQMNKIIEFIFVFLLIFGIGEAIRDVENIPVAIKDEE